MARAHPRGRIAVNTPKIVAEFVDWYTSLPKWQRWVPVAIVAALWLALVLT